MSVTAGATEPIFENAHRQKLVMTIGRSTRRLFLEVYDENKLLAISDDTIVGTATIKLPDQLVHFFQNTQQQSVSQSGSSAAFVPQTAGLAHPFNGERGWFELDTGGRVQLSFQLICPVTTKQLRLGLRVQRGAHWGSKEDDQDGGVGKLGTVIGYRTNHGRQVGECPKQVPELSALVRWDESKLRAFYPCGLDERHVLGLFCGGSAVGAGDGDDAEAAMEAERQRQENIGAKMMAAEREVKQVRQSMENELSQLRRQSEAVLKTRSETVAKAHAEEVASARRASVTAQQAAKQTVGQHAQELARVRRESVLADKAMRREVEKHEQRVNVEQARATTAAEEAEGAQEELKQLRERLKGMEQEAKKTQQQRAQEELKLQRERAEGQHYRQALQKERRQSVALRTQVQTAEERAEGAKQTADHILAQQHAEAQARQDAGEQAQHQLQKEVRQRQRQQQQEEDEEQALREKLKAASLQAEEEAKGRKAAEEELAQFRKREQEREKKEKRQQRQQQEQQQQSAKGREQEHHQQQLLLQEQQRREQALEAAEAKVRAELEEVRGREKKQRQQHQLQREQEKQRRQKEEGEQQQQRRSRERQEEQQREKHEQQRQQQLLQEQQRREQALEAAEAKVRAELEEVQGRLAANDKQAAEREALLVAKQIDSEKEKSLGQQRLNGEQQQQQAQQQQAQQQAQQQQAHHDQDAQRLQEEVKALQAEAETERAERKRMERYLEKHRRKSMAAEHRRKSMTLAATGQVPREGSSIATRVKAEEEAKVKLEEKARVKAEEEAKAKLEEKARIKAEEEAKAKSEEKARVKAEEEAKAKLEEKARIRAAAVARTKVRTKDRESTARMEAEARGKVEAEVMKVREELEAERAERKRMERYLEKHRRKSMRATAMQDGNAPSPMASPMPSPMPSPRAPVGEKNGEAGGAVSGAMRNGNTAEKVDAMGSIERGANGIGAAGAGIHKAGTGADISGDAVAVERVAREKAEAELRAIKKEMEEEKMAKTRAERYLNKHRRKTLAAATAAAAAATAIVVETNGAGNKGRELEQQKGGQVEPKKRRGSKAKRDSKDAAEARLRAKLKEEQAARVLLEGRLRDARMLAKHRNKEARQHKERQVEAENTLKQEREEHRRASAAFTQQEEHRRASAAFTQHPAPPPPSPLQQLLIQQQTPRGGRSTEAASETPSEEAVVHVAVETVQTTGTALVGRYDCFISVSARECRWSDVYKQVRKACMAMHQIDVPKGRAQRRRFGLQMLGEGRKMLWDGVDGRARIRLRDGAQIVCRHRVVLQKEEGGGEDDGDSGEDEEDNDENSRDGEREGSGYSDVDDGDDSDDSDAQFDAAVDDAPGDRIIAGIRRRLSRLPEHVHASPLALAQAAAAVAAEEVRASGSKNGSRGRLGVEGSMDSELSEEDVVSFEVEIVKEGGEGQPLGIVLMEGVEHSHRHTHRLLLDHSADEAARAGLRGLVQEGDELVAIDGQPVRFLPLPIVAATLQAAPAGPIKLRFRRELESANEAKNSKGGSVQWVRKQCSILKTAEGFCLHFDKNGAWVSREERRLIAKRRRRLARMSEKAMRKGGDDDSDDDGDDDDESSSDSSNSASDENSEDEDDLDSEFEDPVEDAHGRDCPNGARKSELYSVMVDATHPFLHPDGLRGPAEEGGLIRAGDVLTSLDGDSLLRLGFGRTIEALKATTVGRAIRFGLLRAVPLSS
jgi:hypothetical protein